MDDDRLVLFRASVLDVETLLARGGGASLVPQTVFTLEVSKGGVSALTTGVYFDIETAPGFGPPGFNLAHEIDRKGLGVLIEKSVFDATAGALAVTADQIAALKVFAAAILKQFP